MPAALLVSKSPPLCGELTVHGAKNSVLPILAATLLCRTPCVLHNCPDILDVTHTLQILRHCLQLRAQRLDPFHRSARLCGKRRPTGARRLHARLEPLSRRAPGPDRDGRADASGRLPHRRAPHRLSPAGIPRSRRVRRRRRRDCPLPGGPAARRSPPPAWPQRRRDGKRHAPASCRRLHHDSKKTPPVSRRSPTSARSSAPAATRSPRRPAP